MEKKIYFLVAIETKFIYPFFCLVQKFAQIQKIKKFVKKGQFLINIFGNVNY
jgi:hypothetical protein